MDKKKINKRKETINKEYKGGMGKKREGMLGREKFQGIEFARTFPWCTIYADFKRLIKVQKKHGPFPLAAI